MLKRLEDKGKSNIQRTVILSYVNEFRIVSYQNDSVTEW
jgi:hypothetical protein